MGDDTPSPAAIGYNLAMNRILTAILCFGLVAAAFAGPVRASSFQPLPALPQVPAGIDNANERTLMQAEIDRLAERARELSAGQHVYDRDCSATAFNPSARRDCQFRLVDLRRDGSRLRAEVLAAEAWFRRVAEESARRRLSEPALRGAAVQAEPAPADRRLGFLRAALEAPCDTWAACLGKLRAETARRAGDAAARDAVACLEAMASGTIAADTLGDRYYRHGVRRFLAGDDWSAALAFARTARDHPDDLRVFDSYALAARRQHASPACRESRHCVGGDLAAWAKRFGPGQAPAAKATLAAAARKDADGPVRAAVLRLRAAMVHAAKAEPPAAAGEIPLARARAAEAAASAGHWVEAADAWLGAWQAAEPGRAARFLALYGGEVPEKPGADRLAALRTALSGDAPGDPFSDALTQAQIILLQR